MGWLGTRLLKRPTLEVEVEEPEPERPAEPEPAAPPLVLLVPDIAGASSFRLHTFYRAESAAAFIGSSLPPASRRGTHAFWALPEEPAETPEQEPSGEAIVLIRAAEESDAVYLVSFVDITSAQSFARFEVKRGLSMGLLMIYWAELVNIRSDEAGIHLSPPAPTVALRGSRSGEPLAPPTGKEPAAPSLGEPAYEAAERLWGAESEVRESPRQDGPAGLETLESPADRAETEQATAMQEAPASGSAPGLEPETAAPQDAEEEDAVIEDLSDSPAEPSKTPVELLDVAETAVDGWPDLELDATGQGLLADPAPEAAQPLDIAEPLVDEPPATEPDTAGQELGAGTVLDKEMSAPEYAEPGVALPQVEQSRTAEPALEELAQGESGQPQEADLDQQDIFISEVEKALRIKRWEKRDLPFRGFDSPPGRF